MRFVLLLLVAIIMPLSVLATQLPANINLENELKKVENSPNLSNQQEISEALRKALLWQNELNKLQSNTANYQKVIDNFQNLSQDLKIQKQKLVSKTLSIPTNLSIDELEQKVLQLNSRQIELNRAIQEEQDQYRNINDELLIIPQQQAEITKKLYEANKQLQEAESKDKTPLNLALLRESQIEVDFYQAKDNELAIQQLSVPNRQILSQLTIDLLKQEYSINESNLLNLRNKLNEQKLQRQKETEKLAKDIEQLELNLPNSIKQQLLVNQSLVKQLLAQTERLDKIAQQQKILSDNISTVFKTRTTLLEQAKWLNMSTTLGQIQRAKIARLPKAAQLQQINTEMAEIRVEQISTQDSLKLYEMIQEHFDALKIAIDEVKQLKTSLGVTNDESITKLPQEKQLLLQEEIEIAQNTQKTTLQNLPNYTPSDQDVPLFNDGQMHLFEQQLTTQKELLQSLQKGHDSLIIELTKLNVLNNQLIDALKEVKDASHRYLFWVADVEPINFSFPLQLLVDLNYFISLNSLPQLARAFIIILTSPDTVMLLTGAFVLIFFNAISRRHYNAFLERAANKVGKVTQDSFSLTLRTLLWSLIRALPLPIFWGTLSYGLQQAWQYPIAVSIGRGISATLPLMWAFMICASFARPNGLFITHLGWHADRVNKALRYYKATIWLVVPLTMALISLDNYSDIESNNRDLLSTIGRLCFFLLCAALFMMTTNLYRAGVPLYLDKKESNDNLVNRTLWIALQLSPIIASIAAACGYLATSQALLGRLDISVIIWFGLLIVYHVIRRLMVIQRRRIEFERAKQKRAERLAQRKNSNDEEQPFGTNNDNVIEADTAEINLDDISAQSLNLIRSILTMIALLSIIIIWSEIYSAFSFLDNIRLWDVTSIVNGVESSQPITLMSILIAILVFVITAQLVRNLPALLELAILQHLDLAPGTSYAITTLTKYILMSIGTLVAFSLIGVDWAKLQWLIAALGVGLGFGLQEIFANFISGLIILFEKPIRINDMVTIRDLTGNIAKINTRATTILDWDRKEIIMPNKAFITEQFTNWSLSDSVTRIVLTVPAEVSADTQEVIDILKKAAEKCSYVMENPQPDAFLVDIQQGIQIFELRVFTAEMGHRMPVRNELHQLIIKAYKEHNLVLPFPPLQIKGNAISRKTFGEISNRHYHVGEL